MSAGFYKYEQPTLLNGTTVLDMHYELHANNHAEYEYPVDGWYWFESREEATQFFGITEEPADDFDSNDDL